MPAGAQVAAFQPDTGRSGLFNRNREVAVMDRRQPLYDAQPIRVGSFGVLASATARLGYTDNIFATKTNRDAAVYGSVTGVADATSDWSRHQLRGFARVDVVGFENTSSENVTLYTIGGTGRYDIAEGANVQAGGQYGRNVVSRLSGRSPTVPTRRVTYDEGRAFIGATYGAQRLRLAGTLRVVEQNYARVATADQTGFQDFADRTVVDGSGRVEYAIGPAVSAFVQVAANDRHFRERQPGRPIRDSHGLEVTAGTSFETPALIRGEVSLGYIQQTFDDSAYRDYSGLAYRAQIQYFPTQLVTVTATADREIDDASIVGVGAFVASTFTLRADYELRRNVIITPQLGYALETYRGYDLQYQRYFGRLEARYTLSPKIVATARYSIDVRNADGTEPGREFTVNQLQAGITYRC